MGTWKPSTARQDLQCTEVLNIWHVVVQLVCHIDGYFSDFIMNTTEFCQAEALTEPNLKPSP